MAVISKAKAILLVSVLIVLGIYFTVTGLVSAKGFLAPLTVAGLMAMILLPLAGRMEKWGVSRGWSAFLSVLVALLFFVGLFFLVGLQGKQIADDWPRIKKQVKPKIEQVQQWIQQKTGIEESKQEQMLPTGFSGGKAKGKNNESGQSKSSGGASADASKKSQSSSGIPSSPGKILMKLISFLGVVLLTCVYIFFMLLYRSKLHKSILSFFPEEKKPRAKSVLKHSVNLSQDYLVGRLMLIGFLVVLYTIGLSISGVKHAILISIIAAFLTFIPYIGNIIGYVLAMAMAAFSGGQMMMPMIGVTITFVISQFVESYVLEPYVVGHKVQLNPLATIVVVVLGGAVWGIVGMIIVIPVFGIIKIVCDHIPALHPVGYSLGEKDIPAEDNLINWGKKIRDRFRN